MLYTLLAYLPVIVLLTVYRIMYLCTDKWNTPITIALTYTGLRVLSNILRGYITPSTKSTTNLLDTYTRYMEAHSGALGEVLEKDRSLRSYAKAKSLYLAMVKMTPPSNDLTIALAQYIGPYQPIKLILSGMTFWRIKGWMMSISIQSNEMYPHIEALRYGYLCGFITQSYYLAEFPKAKKLDVALQYDDAPEEILAGNGIGDDILIINNALNERYLEMFGDQFEYAIKVG